MVGFGILGGRPMTSPINRQPRKAQTTQPCARWECQNRVTYERPLCHAHWRRWETWELEECHRCHWLYEFDDAVVYEYQGHEEEFPFHCDECLYVLLVELGRPPPYFSLRGDPPPEEKPTAPARGQLERQVHHVYIMKLADGSLYVGQTMNLPIRVREHRDGQQSQTKGKDLRLVYYEQFEGMRDEVRERENDLTRLNQTGAGRRRLREMIERFREPLRLLDLEA